MIDRIHCDAGSRKLLRAITLCGVLLTGTAFPLDGLPSSALAASQGILVVVNDQPITNRDVDQRMKLNAALGGTGGSLKERTKRTLNTLINEVVAAAEAKRRKVEFDKKRVDATLEKVAKGSGSTVDGLKATLKKKGISFSTLRAQVKAGMILRWIVSQKLKTKLEVNDAELDRRYSKITSDPRLKPVTLYQIREVDLPFGNVPESMKEQLVYARAVEAQQIAKKYRGCNNLKSAAKGIFNVKVSPLIQAPADKMPGDMKKVLRQAGTKKLIGPMRGPKGIRLIAYCGIRKLNPPKPPREAVKNMLLNEKYEKATDRVMRNLRRRAFIEYKDKNAATLTQ